MTKDNQLRQLGVALDENDNDGVIGSRVNVDIAAKKTPPLLTSSMQQNVLKPTPSGTNFKTETNALTIQDQTKQSVDSLVNNSVLDGSVHIGQEDKHHEKSLMTHVSQDAEIEISSLQKII